MYIIMSIEEFQVVDRTEPPPPTQPREIPPYNGFGSQEDSLASHLNLIPKAPRRYIHTYVHLHTYMYKLATNGRQ